VVELDRVVVEPLVAVAGFFIDFLMEARQDIVGDRLAVSVDVADQDRILLVILGHANMPLTALIEITITIYGSLYHVRPGTNYATRFWVA
jgi:hypothetical protein